MCFEVAEVVAAPSSTTALPPKSADSSLTFACLFHDGDPNSQGPAMPFSDYLSYLPSTEDLIKPALLPA